MAKRVKYLKVEWLDHTTSNSWLTHDEIKKENGIKCSTLGLKISEDKDVLKLASVYENDKPIRAGCLHIIPKGCIISRKELKEEP